MQEFRPLCWLLSAAASILLLSVGPGLAQNVSLPCSAFARNAHGGWKVLAPVVLEIQGRLLAPTVGTTFAAISTANGIEISRVLNQQCRRKAG